MFRSFFFTVFCQIPDTLLLQVALKSRPLIYLTELRLCRPLRLRVRPDLKDVPVNPARIHSASKLLWLVLLNSTLWEIWPKIEQRFHLGILHNFEFSRQKLIQIEWFSHVIMIVPLSSEDEGFFDKNSRQMALTPGGLRLLRSASLASWTQK